jgi:thiol-disulfide isomerase/thioredoxin
MTTTWSRLAAVLVVALLLTACARAPDDRASNAGDPAALSPSPPSGPPEPTAIPPSASTGVAVQLDRAWATATLTDVTTGETFRIADLVASGKVVFMETMAIWCSNCRAQQVEATAAFGELDPEAVVWIALDVESSETAEALARYREDNGFPFTYVIADTDLARALVADFGEVVLSPPSVNIIVVGGDGRITPLRGHKSVAEIRALAAEHGA